MKECCWTQWGSNPQPPDQQSDAHSTKCLRLAESMSSVLDEGEVAHMIPTMGWQNHRTEEELKHEYHFPLPFSKTGGGE